MLAGRIYFCFQWARVRLVGGGAGLAAAAFARSKDRNAGIDPIKPRTSIRSNARGGVFIGANSVSLRPFHPFSETSLPKREFHRRATGVGRAGCPAPEEPIGRKLQTIKYQRR